MSNDDYDKIVLVCVRVGDGFVVTGSVGMRCEECEYPVWVSPASLRAAGPEARIWCTHCVGEQVSKEATIMPLSEGERQEIVAEIAKQDGRRRFHP